MASEARESLAGVTCGSTLDLACVPDMQSVALPPLHK